MILLGSFNNHSKHAGRYYKKSLKSQGLLDLQGDHGFFLLEADGSQRRGGGGGGNHKEREQLLFKAQDRNLSFVGFPKGYSQQKSMETINHRTIRESFSWALATWNPWVMNTVPFIPVVLEDS